MLLAVPNVSEGRDERIVAALAEAFSGRATLLDLHADPVHNRTVLTLAGEPGALVDSLLDGARLAVARIDMRSHEGAHPCVGALDVCPLVWVEDGDRDAARTAALTLADRIADALDIPVFLYGELASSDERRERAFVRRGGPGALAARMQAGELSADRGPATPDPGTGATLVTARPPLAAFNVELADVEGPELAGELATALRESEGGLPGVRAIAIPLGAGRAQISTNVHDPIAVPLGRVVAEVARLAAVHGSRVVGAEVVGLVSEAALAGFPADVPLRDFDPSRDLIERRLAPSRPRR